MYGIEKKSGSRGMTLVELMIAVGITMVIMAMSIRFFQGQFSSYYSGKETKKIQETDCDVGELLRRDLVGAGYGVTQQMAFYIVDGGTTGSDAIYISDPTAVSSDMSLTTSPCPAGTQFTSSGDQMTLANYTQNSSSDLTMFYNGDYNATDFIWVISDTTLSNAGDSKVAQITGLPSANGIIPLKGLSPAQMSPRRLPIT